MLKGEQFRHLNKEFAGSVEGEIPIKYTVPFKWGSLRVTAAADEAYGLVPLTPNFVRGDVQNEGIKNERESPLINVFLVGPSEIGQDVSPNQSFTVGSEISLTKDGFDLSIGLAQDKEILSQNGDEILRALTEITGLNEDELRESLLDEQGIPFDEAYSHSIPQQIAHVIPVIVVNGVKEASGRWIRSDIDRKILRRITAGGAITLGGTVLLMSPEIETGEPVSPVRAGVAAGFLLSSLLINRSEIKKHLAFRRNSEQAIDVLSGIIALQVSKDIHDVYCTEHFDREAERLFEKD